MAEEKYDVVVVGAGVAGLACADEILRKSKKKVLVIEKNDFVGGLAATFKSDGFLYDLAPHRWFTKNEELNEWIDNLIAEEMIWVKKYTPMYQFGKFFDYPIKITDVLKNINPIKSGLMLGSYLYERVKSKVKPTKIRTMKEAYVTRFGFYLYKWFNQEYNEKLWGEGGCEKMSADFVDQRVKNLSFVTAVLNALGLGKEKVISLVPKFRFPKKGIGRISQKLAERIAGNGGVIKLGEKLVTVELQKGMYLIRTTKGKYYANKLISSMPMDVLLRSFGDKTIQPIEKELKKLKYVHQKIVILLAKKRKLTNFTWVYVHPKNIKTFRFMETNNWSTEMSPQGKTSLVFEYPYQIGDEIDKMEDKQLIKITKNDFLKYFDDGSTRESDFIKGMVYRVPYAYPKYDLKYAAAVEKIKKFVKDKFKNLVLIGRSGMFHYNNLDHSIYTGLLAARNEISGKELYDLEMVNNEAEYHEEIRK